MPSDSKVQEPETTDPEVIQQSLRRLDRSTSWFWWNTVIGLILLAAALGTIAAPDLLWRVTLLPPGTDAGAMLRGLLGIMLICNVYTLYHHRHFKLFRERLAEQMQVAVQQRLRADKFYGLAILDPLTDLYNRRYGEECLHKEIARAERQGYDLAVIVIDLDRFKQINDQYGHAAGDEVLKEFSRRLKRAIRACDVPVRIGGDEFLVVLPECPRDNVHIILTRLTPFDITFNRQKIPVSFSRGRAQYQVNDTSKTLVQRADEVLYAEKQSRSSKGANAAGTYAADPPKIEVTSRSDR